MRLLAVIVFAVLAADAPACERAPLVVTRAQLWTPDGFVEDREIVAVNGRITALGSSGSLVRPENARIIDAEGAFLLPGLIDSHAHLFELPGAVPPDVWKQPRAQLFPITGRQLLRSGVTTARVHLFDLADGPALKRDADDDCFPAPRLQFAGPGFMGGDPLVFDKQQWGARNEEDIRRKVAWIHASGAHWVAVHGLNDFAPGHLELIAREARQRGLRLLAGGSTIAEVHRALVLGVDSIEYLDRSEIRAFPDSTLAAMRARPNAAYVPAIGYDHRLAALIRDRSLLDDPMLTQFMSEPLAVRVMADVRRSLVERAKRGGRVERLEAMSAKFRQLVDSGLNVVAGTDCGSLGQFHVDSIWWELETWRRLGVPIEQAILGATARPARIVLHDAGAGQLAVGTRADFLIYAGEMAEAPLDVRRVRVVAKGGVIFVDNGQWVGP